MRPTAPPLLLFLFLFLFLLLMLMLMLLWCAVVCRGIVVAYDVCASCHLSLS